MAGRLRGIYIAETSGGPIRPLQEAEVVEGRGIAGDRPPWNETRHVTLFRREDFEAVVDQIGRSGQVADGANRRNLEIEGLSLDELRGPTLKIGTVVLKVTDDCDPCKNMENSVGPGAKAAMAGRGGVCCVVEHGGSIRVGDAVISERR